MKGAEADELAARKNRYACTQFDWPCTAIKGNMLYPCPFLSSSEASECVPYNERNHLDLLSPGVSKESVIAFFESVYPGCAWCTQEHYEQGYTDRIPVAEQTDGPIYYKRYPRKE
jgi:hypothetical protein